MEFDYGTYGVKLQANLIKNFRPFLKNSEEALL